MTTHNASRSLTLTFNGSVWSAHPLDVRLHPGDTLVIKCDDHHANVTLRLGKKGGPGVEDIGGTLFADYPDGSHLWVGATKTKRLTVRRTAPHGTYVLDAFDARGLLAFAGDIEVVCDSDKKRDCP